MHRLGVVASLHASSRALTRLSAFLAIFGLMAGSQASFAQVCIDPPPIGGPQGVGTAPPGWSVAANTPDVVAGNGPWPGGGYTISDVSGTSTSGGTMGLFLNQDPGYVGRAASSA